MGLCSSFTIIDFIRVGGISTLMKGKAVYQIAQDLDKSEEYVKKMIKENVD